MSWEDVKRNLDSDWRFMGTSGIETAKALAWVSEHLDRQERLQDAARPIPRPPSPSVGRP